MEACKINPKRDAIEIKQEMERRLGDSRFKGRYSKATQNTNSFTCLISDGEGNESEIIIFKDHRLLLRLFWHEGNVLLKEDIPNEFVFTDTVMNWIDQESVTSISFMLDSNKLMTYPGKLSDTEYGFLDEIFMISKDADVFAGNDFRISINNRNGTKADDIFKYIRSESSSKIIRGLKHATVTDLDISSDVLKIYYSRVQKYEKHLNLLMELNNYIIIKPNVRFKEIVIDGLKRSSNRYFSATFGASYYYYKLIFKENTISDLLKLIESSQGEICYSIMNGIISYASVDSEEVAMNYQAIKTILLENNTMGMDAYGFLSHLAMKLNIDDEIIKKTINAGGDYAGDLVKYLKKRNNTNDDRI